MLVGLCNESLGVIAVPRGRGAANIARREEKPSSRNAGAGCPASAPWQRDARPAKESRALAESALALRRFALLEVAARTPDAAADARKCAPW